MLAEYHEKQKPLTAMAAPGPVMARDQEGALVLPAPVDYVAWTERVAAFATASQFSSRAPAAAVALGADVAAGQARIRSERLDHPCRERPVARWAWRIVLHRYAKRIHIFTGGGIIDETNGKVSVDCFYLFPDCPACPGRNRI